MAEIAPYYALAGIFAPTRAKVLLAVSILITWWFASALPHYHQIIQAGIQSRLDEARQKIPAIKVDWRRISGAGEEDPRDAYNRSKVAMLIEARPLPHLVPHILHMMAVVPPDWRFLFVGSEDSVVSVARAYAVKHQQVIGKLDLLVLPEPWSISGKEDVHRMLTDVRFYNEFLPDVEWILKYESDSILCANSDKSLNEWLGWSWTGAPRHQDDRFSGNGGLSLRRVSAIKRVLAFQARYNDTEPEDEWFGKRVYIMPGERVASGTETALAVEDIYIEQPMGYHVRDGGRQLHPDVWANREQRRTIFEYCPELSLIMDMKLERERCQGDDGNGEFEPDGREEEQREIERLEQEREKERLEKLIADERGKSDEAEKKKAEQAEEDTRKSAEGDAVAEGSADGSGIEILFDSATATADESMSTPIPAEEPFLIDTGRR